jgi:single-strand DNA-binding protein
MLKATLIGNLGGDPETRYTADGRPFLRFNVACNFRNRNPDGEWQDKTEWVRVTAFGPRAESLSQFLRKGTKVYVEGRLEARPWTDQQQQVRAGLEVLANASEIEFMSPRTDEDGGEPSRFSGGTREAQAAAPPRQAPAPQQPAQSDDAELEDLPF